MVYGKYVLNNLNLLKDRSSNAKVTTNWQGKLYYAVNKLGQF